MESKDRECEGLRHLAGGATYVRESSEVTGGDSPKKPKELTKDNLVYVAIRFTAAFRAELARQEREKR